MQYKSLSKEDFERMEVEVVEERHRRNALNPELIRVFRTDAKLFVYFVCAEKSQAKLRSIYMPLTL